MSAETVTISSLGAKGDGVAHGEKGPVFVPFALPGETVAIARVKNDGMIMSFASTSPDRIAPACKHFGPDGVGGTHVMYVLHHADTPRLYAGLPDQPVISPLVGLWKGFTKPLALLAMGRRAAVSGRNA